MFCPSCKHENPEDATFCGECGATLVGTRAKSYQPFVHVEEHRLFLGAAEIAKGLAR